MGIDDFFDIEDDEFDLAKRALAKQVSWLEFKIVARLSDLSKVFEVTRIKGGVKLGIVRRENGKWQFSPAVGVKFSAEELHEVKSIMDGQK